MKANQRRKGTFEKLFLDGRPPINVGVTSGGDLFGGSQVTFSDVLGDQQFNLFVASISQYRTLSLSYVNLSRRLQYAVQGFTQTSFFYGLADQRVLRSRPLAVPRSRRCGRDADDPRRHDLRHLSVEPLHAPRNGRRRRAVQGRVRRRRHRRSIRSSTQIDRYGTVVFNNGTLVPLSLTLVQEDTVFREFGPLAGSTMRLSYEVAPKIGNTLQRQIVDGDFR